MRSINAAVALITAATPVIVASAPATADTVCTITSAVGIPAMTVGGAANAGAVEVRTSCASTPQLLTLPTPRTGDRFGASITDAYLSDDAHRTESLVIGVPGYDVGSLTDAGAVAIFTRSSAGTTFSSLVIQDGAGVPGTPQAGARFGAAVSSASGNPEVDAEGAEIAIGEPGLDVGGVVDAGGYVTVRYQGGSLQPDASHETTLDTPGVAHIPLRGDLLGSSVQDIDDQVVAGAPGRQVDGHAGAGAVLFDRNLITQDTACMPGVPEAGDHFGASLVGRWIGVPDEDLGSIRDAGLVERYDPDNGQHGAQCYELTQDTPGMSGSREAGDRFGAALGEFHTNDCDARLCYAPFELAVGVPGEDTGTHVNSGFVNLVNEQLSQESDSLTISPDRSTLGPGTSGAGFGAAFGERQTSVQVSAPGAAIVYDYDGRNQTSPVVDATYRPSVSVPANSYGVALSNHDE